MTDDERDLSHEAEEYTSGYAALLEFNGRDVPSNE